MNKQIFRKKSLERVASPEDLNDYLHVTNVGIWVVLSVITVFLIGVIIWSNFASIESYAYGTAQISEGMVIASFNDENVANNVEMGMNLIIGDIVVPIESLGNDSEGKVMAVAYADLPDGNYDIKVGYKQTQIIKMLFN